MLAEELLNGIAVIIDDKVNDEATSDPIKNIKSQIQTKKIPILGYDDIPNEEEIKHFSNASFIIIDWALNPLEEDDTLLGVTKGSGIKGSEEDQLADFIFKLKKHYFGPVFIFSKESEETIRGKLQIKFQEEGGGAECKDLIDYIFIKEKKDLIDGKFFDVIDSWFKEKPSIYVIKKWDQSVDESKKDLFWYLYELNHYWPQIFWNIFIEDGSDPSHELRDLLMKNLTGRMVDCNFLENSIIVSDKSPDNQDIRKILCGERFIPNKQLSENLINCGDIFQSPDDSDLFYINIRPQCDCMARNGGNQLDNIELYLLKARKMSDKTENDYFDHRFNNFKEKNNCTILPFIGEFDSNGQIIVVFTLNVKFKDVKIKKYGTVKGNRIGRLIPPYITNIRQKYANYLIREGLMPVPKSLFEEPIHEEINHIDTENLIPDTTISTKK